MVVNNFSRSEEVYRQTEAFLVAAPHVREAILDPIFAYKEAGYLVPETIDTFMSGHYFPFAQSENEIESSFNLATQGFYGYACSALRSTFELTLLGLYFAVNEIDYGALERWLDSKERTPGRKAILSKLATIPAFPDADARFGLTNRILQLFDELDGYVHTRGYKYSSRKLTRTNYNFFSQDSVLLYQTLLANVVTSAVFLMILRYPIGMQPLPLTEKFGLRPPLSGFLEEYQVQRLHKALSADERAFLQTLSDTDPSTQSLVNEIIAMPDLTDEQWKAQREEGVEGFSFPDGHGGWTVALTKPKPQT